MMVSDKERKLALTFLEVVLILVLVDDGLWQSFYI